MLLERMPGSENSSENSKGKPRMIMPNWFHSGDTAKLTMNRLIMF